jgi:hypothetical protein
VFQLAVNVLALGHTCYRSGVVLLFLLSKTVDNNRLDFLSTTSTGCSFIRSSHLPSVLLLGRLGERTVQACSKSSLSVWGGSQKQKVLDEKVDSQQLKNGTYSSDENRESFHGLEPSVASTLNGRTVCGKTHPIKTLFVLLIEPDFKHRSICDTSTCKQQELSSYSRAASGAGLRVAPLESTVDASFSVSPKPVFPEHDALALW